MIFSSKPCTVKVILQKTFQKNTVYDLGRKYFGSRGRSMAALLKTK